MCNRINTLIGKIAIIVGSIIFYAYSDWNTLKILVFSLTVNFVFSYIIKHVHKWNRVFITIPIVINVGLLIYFKYTDFLISNYDALLGRNVALKEIVLPVGISFFTFQQIAYIVAVYNNEIEKINLIDYMAYILYFPKILMGPLMEPKDFVEQINNSELKKFNWDNIACGIKIFSFGLFKKAFLADTFANAVSWGYNNIDVATSVDWLFIMLFYTFEIYFDFSGYSDMATGISLMINITLPINFDSPYKALSIRDFWNRWHISLTRFFTKYIYIPLGGSRRGKIVTYANTMIVFFVSGLWHGADWTFILWGILNGVISIFERITEKIQIKIIKPVRWIVTFALVNVLWLLFSSNSIIQWKDILTTILTFRNNTISIGLASNFQLYEYALLEKIIPYVAGLNDKFWMVVFSIASLGVCLIPMNNYRNLYKNSFVTMLLSAIAFVWGFISIGGESVFVYFNF
jgi:alginate O-acetyltransferase complex protein AlgI